MYFNFNLLKTFFVFSRQPLNQNFLQQKELAFLGEKETALVDGKGKGKWINTGGNELSEVRLFRGSQGF